jgi:hypothetical protein
MIHDEGIHLCPGVLSTRSTALRYTGVRGRKTEVFLTCTVILTGRREISGLSE